MRYKTKRTIKSGIIIGCILLVGLWIGSAYFDIPQINSVKKMINLAEYSKQPIQLKSYLSVGETGKNDDISITLEAIDFSDKEGINRVKEGAKFLFVKIKSTNSGKFKTSRIDPKKVTKLYYAGVQIPLWNQNSWITTGGCCSEKYHTPEWSGYGDIYPNVTTEGWMWFEVPENINLAETTLDINGLTWKLG